MREPGQTVLADGHGDHGIEAQQEKVGQVVPGEAFGSPNHVRLSYALSMDAVRDGLERIARALY